VIEALQLGTPVIASDLPCFREIGEGIPTLLDPIDAIGWERTVTSFLDNCPERMRQLRLLQDYRAPSWNDHFGKLEGWLENLAPARPARPGRTEAQVPSLPAAEAKLGSRASAAKLMSDGA
jgi:hypothetical protein